MPLERRRAAARYGVPELDSIVGRRRRERLRVGGEYDRQDRAAMPLERSDVCIPI